MLRQLHIKKIAGAPMDKLTQDYASYDCTMNHSWAVKEHI